MKTCEFCGSLTESDIETVMCLAKHHLITEETVSFMIVLYTVEPNDIVSAEVRKTSDMIE